jgi:maleate cis-trans isomerase
MRANPGVDALFIACTQLPTHEVLDGLEREFKRPAWSSIRATAWQASRACVQVAAH